MSDVQPDAVAPEPTDIDQLAPAPELAPEPQPEPVAAPEPAAADTPPEPAPEAGKKRKTAEQALQGRVGYLTKVNNEKDAALAEAQRQLEAYQALLANGGVPAAPDGAPPIVGTTPPAPGTDAFRQAVAQEARRVAAQAAFDAECNKVFEQGVKTHGDAFKEAVANLNHMGIVAPGNDTFLEAALATDAPDAVLNHLGNDLDEAQRIASLPPIRMAAELTRLSARLASGGNTAPAAPRTSSAPPPIKPVGGAAKPSGDIYDPGLSDEEYYARRAAAGAPYIRVKQR